MSLEHELLAALEGLVARHECGDWGPITAGHFAAALFNAAIVIAQARAALGTPAPERGIVGELARPAGAP